MSDSQAKTLVVVGVTAIVASVIGLVLGLVMVGNLSDYLEESVGVTESALGAVEETLGLIESVTNAVEGAVGGAAQSIAAISEAASARRGLRTSRFASQQPLSAASFARRRFAA